MEKSAHRVIVDVDGVGYEVHIPFSTYYELGEVGEPVTLRIHTHVREDALSLYGFLTGDEKKLFRQLIQISGIGPRLAVTILSGLPVEEFVEAVNGADVVKLNRIPGVGRKTAERLLVEMKDKMLELFPEVETGAAAEPLQQDVVSALVNLGYPRKTAEKAVSQVQQEESTDRFEILLRKSLKSISG